MARLFLIQIQDPLRGVSQFADRKTAQPEPSGFSESNGLLEALWGSAPA
jgi:hypothetical protein